MKHFLRTVCNVLACVLVAAGIGLMLLTAALVSSQVALGLGVAPLALAVTQAMPAPLAFWGVLSSPFGGVFRTDFMVLALILGAAAKVVRLIRGLL